MRVKNICLYKPSFTKERKLRSIRKSTATGSEAPNRNIYKLIKENSTLQISDQSVSDKGRLPEILKRKKSVTAQGNRHSYNTISETPNFEIIPKTFSKKEDSINIVAKKRPPALNIGYNELGIEPKRTVLYRNFHEISGKIYLVEISRSKTKIFFLLFENFENPSKYMAETLLEKIALKLM